MVWSQFKKIWILKENSSKQKLLKKSQNMYANLTSISIAYCLAKIIYHIFSLNSPTDSKLTQWLCCGPPMPFSDLDLASFWKFSKGNYGWKFLFGKGTVVVGSVGSGWELGWFGEGKGWEGSGWFVDGEKKVRVRLVGDSLIWNLG